MGEGGELGPPHQSLDQSALEMSHQDTGLGGSTVPLISSETPVHEKENASEASRCVLPSREVGGASITIWLKDTHGTGTP